MKNNVRWFVKPINDITNESIHNFLARSSAHQDIFASQEIAVRGQKELLIEVPAYEIIKRLYASALNMPFLKFQVYIMPPGARQAGLWKLKDFHGIKIKIKSLTHSQAQA